MRPPTPRYTRTDTLYPYKTLIRSQAHRQSVIVAPHGQNAAARVEAHRQPVGIEAAENYPGRRQRRMAAQSDLDRGREPAQVVILAARHEEGGLGQVVLDRKSVV